MPRVSTLIHAHNDERNLVRALSTLHPCDEIVVVDHGSIDKTVRVARQHGAKVVKAVQGVDRGAYAVDCSHDWVLCLLPNESLAESFEASLLDWKRGQPGDNIGYSVAVREQAPEGWREVGLEMRLVNRNKINWQGFSPAAAEDTALLTGEILRFPEEGGTHVVDNS